MLYKHANQIENNEGHWADKELILNSSKMFPYNILYGNPNGAALIKKIRLG